MTPGIERLLQPLRTLHDAIRDQVLKECERSSVDDLADIVADGAGDTIYSVDRVSEAQLVSGVESEIATLGPVVLVAEGLQDGHLTLPHGTAPEKARWRLLVDPIDGTRGLMYQKRSAWILTGVAPNRGDNTRLSDIELAVQTEIPLLKQHLSDQVWATRGGGVGSQRFDRITGRTSPLSFRPSTASSLEHGFAMIARFFPGVRDELAAIDEELIRRVIGPSREGKAHCFEDQYISSGGQLYELMAGHDRFVADLRPLMEPLVKERGLALGICCHPYDVATELIARELGVIITGARGQPLDARLCVDEPVAWAGYANQEIFDRVSPHLLSILQERGWLQ